MLKNSSKIVLMTVLASIIGATSMTVMADTQWQKNHPAREQVNNRLKNQNRRIHKEVKEGDITKQQAHQLHQQDHSIRQEERGMASQNGGRLTPQEHNTLNQQENGVSSQIGH